MLYIPNFGFNLFSISSFLNNYKNCTGNFSRDYFNIQRNKMPILIGKCNKISGLYIFGQDNLNKENYISSIFTEVWHYSFRHPSSKKMYHLKSHILNVTNKFFIFHICSLTKQRRFSFVSNNNMSKKHFQFDSL